MHREHGKARGVSPSRSSRPRSSRRHRKALETLEKRRLLAAHIVGDSTVYATIQEAVNAAAVNATITVDPGTYAELVTIPKALTLRGAGAGVDGRTTQRRNGFNESVLTGFTLQDGTVSSAIKIVADDVTLDGFTVQGNTSNTLYGAAIIISPNISGTKLLNNVVQNNICGVALANASSTKPTLIQHNFFQLNNLDGLHSGNAIHGDGSTSGGLLTNVTIDGNTFFRNFGGASTTTLEAAISLQTLAPNSQSNIRITNNIFDSNGKALLLYNSNGVLIESNYFAYARDTTSAGLRFEGGNTNITIRNNTLSGSGARAIRIDNKAVPYENSNFTITNNNIFRNGLNLTTKDGLYVNAGMYAGPLDATNNWWGSDTGPRGDGPGTGDGVYGNGANVIFTPWAAAPVVTRQTTPYYGVPQSLGLAIQFEDYDNGGEGFAYHDSDASLELGESPLSLVARTR